MRDLHLSDEAVAACADGVLRGHARERALRHTNECAECAQAVRVQREAVLALRTAPAPALPTALLERLREVPITTPIRTAPTVLGEDGSTLLATFSSSAMAALAPAAALVAPAGQPSETLKTGPAHSRARHLRPIVLTTAMVAAAGVLTVSSASAATTPTSRTSTSSVSSSRSGSPDSGGSDSGRTEFEDRRVPVGASVPAP